MRVLIVDDDHLICRCLKKMIRWSELGCEEPEIAYDGFRALELIEKNCPGIVITDIRMPGMDGIELCKQLYEKYPNITMFLISAYEDFYIARLALQYNVKGYVLKPFDQRSLSMLEDMIRTSTHKKRDQELCNRILNNEYSEFLEKILDEKNQMVFEEFMDMLKSIEKEVIAQNPGVWINLLRPILKVQYKQRNMDSRLLFSIEQEMQNDLQPLTDEEKIEYVRSRYSDSMIINTELNKNIIWEVQRVVKEEFSSPDLNVNRLGEVFHMSPVYLGKIFMERTGIKLVDYIGEKRIQYASEELRNTLKPIGEIAIASGYPNANYFSRVFRKKTGLSPQDYRQQYHHTGGINQSIEKE